MSPRAHGNGVRKVCRCGWRRWAKCPHAWYFSYKPRGGQRQRFSLDVELGGQHVGSKIEAEKLATDIRSAINAGTYERVADRQQRERREAEEARDRAKQETAAAPEVVTLTQFAKIYIDRASKPSGKQSWRNDSAIFARFCAFAPDGQPCGEWPLTRFTEDTIEVFHASLGALAASTRNQYVQLLKASFRWAARKGYLSRSPISEGSALKRTKGAQRRRRVLPDEEQRLLDAAGRVRHDAGVRLQWLIIAGIESGCRRGELLALQWADVNLPKRTVFVRATEVGAKKSGRSRLLPLSTRLAAVLEMARLDPAGNEYPSSAYVFGALGERISTFNKAWETAVLRTHGHEPEWVRSGALSPTSRALLETIDLHFHDLRHEAGCRWLEQGWPIHHVQEMLGHANLSQTSTYLHASELGLQESMRRFDAARGKPVAKEAPIEHPPVCHEEADADEKGTLH
jgi:integrase